MTDLHELLKKFIETITLRTPISLDKNARDRIESLKEIDRRLKRLDEIKEICLFDPVAKYEDWVYEYIKEFLEDD